MSTDPNLHCMEVTDNEGEVWIAEQMLGITVSSIGHPPQSHVRFINSNTGQELSGRALGADAATREELTASLAEAKRQHRLGAGAKYPGA